MATSNTAVAKRTEPTPAQRTHQILMAREKEFGQALAGRIDPGAFIRVAYATISKVPKLMEATPGSLLMALMEAASLGLMPNGVMGEAYIVPFNNKIKEGKTERWEVQAQFIPGYRGLIKLARQSGVVRTIVPRAVRAGDRFEVEYGLDDRLVHTPDLDAIDEKPITHVYAVAYFQDGTRQFEVMSKKQVDAIRARSKSKDSGPWVSDYEPMALKTVIRRLVKYLPLSDWDLSRAIEADDRFDLGASDVSMFANVDVTEALPETRSAQLRGRLASAKTDEKAAEETTSQEDATDAAAADSEKRSGETAEAKKPLSEEEQYEADMRAQEGEKGASS